MHLRTGVISIETKEYRSGQCPRRLFYSLIFRIRTEGAWEGCPSHAPLSSAKKGKNCACTLFNFFLIPYYIIPHKWVSDHMKVE